MPCADDAWKQLISPWARSFTKPTVSTSKTAELSVSRPERVHVSDAVRNVQTWVPSSEYAEAEPNPLAEASESLLSKMTSTYLNKVQGLGLRLCA